MTQRITAHVNDYMTKHAYQVTPGAKLKDALQIMDTHQISSLAVTNAGALKGVISRTDLLRVMQRNDGELREENVAEKMTSPALTTSPESPIQEAAKIMVERKVHRLYVTRGEALLGVLSTKDLLRLLQREKIETPISSFMTSPVITIEKSETLEAANQKLLSENIHGLAVVDDDWPIGIYTQFEALHAKKLPANTKVEDIMSYALFCLSVSTPLYRAAAYSAQMGIRRIMAVEHRQAQGILTDFDLARAIAAF